jgi:hypothetical protein
MSPLGISTFQICRRSVVFPKRSRGRSLLLPLTAAPRAPRAPRAQRAQRAPRSPPSWAPGPRRARASPSRRRPGPGPGAARAAPGSLSLSPVRSDRGPHGRRRPARRSEHRLGYHEGLSRYCRYTKRWPPPSLEPRGEAGLAQYVYMLRVLREGTSTAWRFADDRTTRTQGRSSERLHRQGASPCAGAQWTSA